MSDDIRCPSCGEDDDLRGQPIGKADNTDPDTDTDDAPTGIRVTCGSCDATWERTGQATCPRCSGDNMYLAPVAIIEKSRGSQLSILGTRTTPLCWECDRDLIDAQRQSGTALMPAELPTLDRKAE